MRSFPQTKKVGHYTSVKIDRTAVIHSSQILSRQPSSADARTMVEAAWKERNSGGVEPAPRARSKRGSLPEYYYPQLGSILTINRSVHATSPVPFWGVSSRSWFLGGEAVTRCVTGTDWEKISNRSRCLRGRGAIPRSRLLDRQEFRGKGHGLDCLLMFITLHLESPPTAQQ